MFKFSNKSSIKDYKCTIRLLDDADVLLCEFQKEQKGQALIDYVCTYVNLEEKDYFGLRYVDSHNQRHWLDPAKPILKQVKGLNPIVLCFRVKFYPPDPLKLQEEITRYQLYLQLRRDLQHGRLYSSQNDLALLGAYIVQSELGDYDPEEHTNGYISQYKIVLKQTSRLEEKIAEIHRAQLSGQVPSVAEDNFLSKACTLDTYGVDPHPVKDQKGNQLYMGINHSGIMTFQAIKKTHHFKWQDIQKIHYEGKMFIVHLLLNEKKHAVGFKCPSSSACKHLWKCAVEQRAFFTLNSSSEIQPASSGGGLFSRKSKFRYSGRVEKEVLSESKQIKREAPTFIRSPVKPQLKTRKKTFQILTPTSETEPPDPSFHYNSLKDVPHSTPLPKFPVVEEECIIEESAIVNEVPIFMHENMQDESTLTDDLFQNESENIIEDNPPPEEISSSVEHEDLNNSVQEEELSVFFEKTENLPNYWHQKNHKMSEFNSHMTVPEFPSELDEDDKRWAISGRTLIVVTILILVILCILFILLLESTCEHSWLATICQMPEFLILKYDYYGNAKKYFARKINIIFGY